MLSQVIEFVLLIDYLDIVSHRLKTWLLIIFLVLSHYLRLLERYLILIALGNYDFGLSRHNLALSRCLQLTIILSKLKAPSCIFQNT